MARENFASGKTAIMAMAGSAIGLGNIWRFPYMVGQNGGATFVLIYLFCVLLLCLPIFIAESTIGRCSGSNTFGAMAKLAPGTKWKWIGLLTVITPLIILSYYSVVGGWSVDYMLKSVISGFSSDAPEYFGRFTSSVWKPLIFHTIFLSLTCIIVLRGVKAGIEKFNKASLPLLFILIVAIAVYSMTLPGASEGIAYMLKPDFSSLSARSFAYAMGQGFFSLSIGVGAILTYSSYMKKDESLIGSAAGTAIFDLMFAVIAGLAVMPAVFAAGIEPGAGPGLIFETLPYIFSQMAEEAPLLSRVVSICFFVTIVFAALTSSISLVEVGVSYLAEEHGYSRRKAVLVIFSIAWTLGAVCSLSFGPLAGVKLFGLSAFSFCDVLTSNFLITFGSLLFVIFVGWKMDRELVRNEITNGGTLPFACRVFKPLYFMIRYVAPVVLVAIFLTNFML